jgi:multiple sugar transport system substrate-binding protein
MRHVTAAAAAALAALCGSGAFAQEVTTITIWGTEPEPNATEILAEEFDAQRDDIEIEFRNIPFSDVNQEYMRGIATNSGPDILMVNTTDTHFYAASGVLLDLTDMIAASDVIRYDEIFPGYQAAITYEDGSTRCRVGAILDDLLQHRHARGGGSTRPLAPDSWDQLNDYVARLTDPEERVFGIAFSAKNNQEGPLAVADPSPAWPARSGTISTPKARCAR